MRFIMSPRNWITSILCCLSCSIFTSAISQDPCAAVQARYASDGVIEGVSTLSNSIGYAGLDVVEAAGQNKTDYCRVRVARLQNKAGAVVTASADSAQSAVRSKVGALLDQSLCAGFGLCADVSDADDSDCWPITAITALQDYITYILSSPAAIAIARNLHWAEMPRLISQRAVDIIRDGMTCPGRNGSLIAVKDFDGITSTWLKGGGSSMQATLQRALTNAYFINTVVSISYVSTGSGQGQKDLIAGRLDFSGSESIIDTKNPVVIARRFQMLPMFAGAIAVVYNNPSVDNLILTRTLVNDIFLGRVTSWGNEAVVHANPPVGAQIYQPRKESFVRVVRSDSSGTTETFTRALYLFQGLPIPPNYSLHILQGKSFPTWPEAPYPYFDGAVCVLTNCSAPNSCPAGTVLVGDVCMSFPAAAAAMGAPVLAAVLVCCAVIVALVRHGGDQSYCLIKEHDLTFEEPPKLLGAGSFGEVFKAEYRGTPVAVKIFRAASAGGGGGTSSGLGSQLRAAIQQLLSSGRGVVHPVPEGGDFQGELGLVSLRVRSGSDGLGSLSGIRRSGSDGMGSSPGIRRSGSDGMGSLSSIRRSGSVLRQSGGGRSHGRSSSWWRREFIKEIRFLSKLRHPSITTVLGVVAGKIPKLVMEYMDSGSLKDILRNPGIMLDCEEQHSLLTDVCKGMRFLHEATPAIIHSDVKSENVLVDENFRAKVADFGLSLYKKPTILSVGQSKGHCCAGTPFFMAPELLRNESPSSKESDIYAFAILMYEVFSREDPYAGEDTATVLKEVQNRNRIPDKRPPIPSKCPPLMQALMQECWHREPLARPTFAEVDRRLMAMVDTNSSGERVASTRRRSSVSIGNLYQSLPEHIAVALSRGEKVPPEHKEMVTVYFSDIVGFTTISSNISSAKVSDMLNRLYSCFDAVADKYGVYKIETIGDAYLAVTNLTSNQDDTHAAMMARFAEGALEAAASVLIDPEDPSKGSVTIRVGLASGPVTATVLGSRSPKYTLLGDTMNTASRMESNSIPGRIQCTEITASLIAKQAPDIELELRGEIPIKGKGHMRTFWVGCTSCCLGRSDISQAEPEAEAVRTTKVKFSGSRGITVEASIQPPQPTASADTGEDSTRVASPSLLDRTPFMDPILPPPADAGAEAAGAVASEVQEVTVAAQAAHLQPEVNNIASITKITAASGSKESSRARSAAYEVPSVGVRTAAWHSDDENDSAQGRPPKGPTSTNSMRMSTDSVGAPAAAGATLIDDELPTQRAFSGRT